MKKEFVVLVVLVLTSAIAAAQSRYIVFFKSKGATTFSLNQPSAYLSPRAIDRRSRQHIAIDSTDLPVPKTYIDNIASVAGVTVGNVSKWLNAISITISNPSVLTTINQFPFVRTVRVLALRKSTGGSD